MPEMRQYKDFSDELNDISGRVIDCAFQVHKTLGPGSLEVNYEDAFTYELEKKNLVYERQKRVQIPYKDIVLKSYFRFDLVVANQILIELKAVEKIHPIHKAQVIAYLKAVSLPIGILINFNVPLIKDGINRLTLRPSGTPC